jgi:hypothetical protein
MCRSWRQAVQQCRACNTDVKLGPCASLHKLSSFAKWLPKHFALVRSIALLGLQPSYEVNEVHPGMAVTVHLDIAQQLLLSALQLTAAQSALQVQTAAAAAAAESTCSATAAPQQQQQQGWRLASFSCSWPDAASMLAALPAHSLTHLGLTLDDNNNFTGPEGLGPVIAAVLARLSNLQQLQLDTDNITGQVQDHDNPYSVYVGPGGCWIAFAHLSRLTSLQLRGD